MVVKRLRKKQEELERLREKVITSYETAGMEIESITHVRPVQDVTTCDANDTASTPTSIAGGRGGVVNTTATKSQALLKINYQ